MLSVEVPVVAKPGFFALSATINCAAAFASVAPSNTAEKALLSTSNPSKKNFVELKDLMKKETIRPSGLSLSYKNTPLILRPSSFFHTKVDNCIVCKNVRKRS